MKVLASLALAGACLQAQPPKAVDSYIYGPFRDDPVAAKAHERLVANRPLIEWIEIRGSDPRILPKGSFSSRTIGSQLAELKWPKTAGWAPVSEFGGTKTSFDLADAYVYCFVAHVALASPDWGDVRYAVRPWPMPKIKRQFQRAISVAGSLTQDEKERLYVALVRSADRARDWWNEIEMAINARGDVIGHSHEDANSVMKWLLGIGVDELEIQQLKAGIRREIEPRSNLRRPPP